MELENRMISAEWLERRCYEICDEYNTEHLYIDRIIDEIDEAPDVELVRCKDCRFLIDREDGTHGCYRHFMEECKLDDFCSYGERKDNGIRCKED